MLMGQIGLGSVRRWLDPGEGWLRGVAIGRRRVENRLKKPLSMAKSGVKWGGSA